MSQYLYNKHNTTCKVLRSVFTYSLILCQKSQLVRCAHSFDFRYKNNSCVNTVRQHFPWSILYFSAKYRAQNKHTWIHWYKWSESARLWRQKAERDGSHCVWREFVPDIADSGNWRQRFLLFSYLYFRVCFACYPPKSFKTICLTCIWLKFVDISFHSMQN